MTRPRLRYRARPHLGPFRINIARGRGILPRVASVSVKAGPFTWNPTRRTASVDTPGIGSVMIPYGAGGRGAVTTKRAYPPGTDERALAEIPCRTCGSTPGVGCRTSSGQPTRLHKARRDDAAALVERGPSATPGGRTRTPGPISPLGRLLGRVLGWLAVVLLAWVWVAVLGAHSFLDVTGRWLRP